jgi:hypothetical protein
MAAADIFRHSPPIEKRPGPFWRLSRKHADWPGVSGGATLGPAVESKVFE